MTEDWQQEFLIDLPVAAGVLDQAGRFTMVNGAALRLLGAASAEDVIGRAVDAVFATGTLADVDGLDMDRWSFIPANVVRADGSALETRVALRRVEVDGAPMTVIVLTPFDGGELEMNVIGALVADAVTLRRDLYTTRRRLGDVEREVDQIRRVVRETAVKQAEMLVADETWARQARGVLEDTAGRLFRDRDAEDPDEGS